MTNRSTSWVGIVMNAKSSSSGRPRSSCSFVKELSCLRRRTKETTGRRTTMGSNKLLFPCRTTFDSTTQFIGRSLALAIPLLMLRRQRAGLQIALKPAPPRRTASPSLCRPASLPASSLSVENTLSADPDRASLNMMSALSHVNPSSAILAAKAFAIATGIVAVGGAVFIWGIKETLGVKDVCNSSVSLRSICWKKAYRLVNSGTRCVSTF